MPEKPTAPSLRSLLEEWVEEKRHVGVEETPKPAPALAPQATEGANAPAPSRKARRRRPRPRSLTIAMKRLTTEELRVGALMYPPADVQRPRIREQCESAVRPCPWVACKYHIYLDVNPDTGSIKLNFPDLEPWELVDSCTLDVAARGGITLEEVGDIMNMTRERIRQVEVRGLIKLKMSTTGTTTDPLKLK